MHSLTSKRMGIWGFASVQITTISDSRNPVTMCAEAQVAHNEVRPWAMPPLINILNITCHTFYPD